jgi:hypothetical protein
MTDRRLKKTDAELLKTLKIAFSRGENIVFNRRK